ncbi:Uncharacterised protein [Mycobacteroides abscessus subsp. abscessus]|nr:Uncharacterised protein [Mycobacteroides abscessus subsp. abscessus]
MYRPTATSRPLAIKGTRHPHDRNAGLSSPIVRLTMRKTRLLSNSPVEVPIGTAVAARPRFWLGEYSAESNAAPLHSPPTARPCTSRSMTMAVGAAAPMVAAPGTRPTAMVASPMVISVTTKVPLRLKRSP